ADLLLLGDQRVVQLLQAAGTELVVGRPVGRVERLAGRRDRGVHVTRRAVCDDTENALGRRIDVVEGGAGLALAQLTVDQQPTLAGLAHDTTFAGTCFQPATLVIATRLQPARSTSKFGMKSNIISNAILL